MALLSFRKPGTTRVDAPASHGGIAALIEGYSIEVMPRTAAKVEDFRALLPAGTRVYIAHIDGTGIDDMVATARRLRDEGFEPMPHFPARSIPGPATLADWIRRYQTEAGVKQGLLLGGGHRHAARRIPFLDAASGERSFRRCGFHPSACGGPPRGQPGHRSRRRRGRGDGGTSLETGFRKSLGRAIRHRHAIRLRSRGRRGLGRAAGGGRHRNAGASGHRGPGEASDADQVRHRLRRSAPRWACCRSGPRMSPSCWCPSSRPSFWRIWPRARPPARRRTSSASTSSRWVGSRQMPPGRSPMAAKRGTARGSLRRLRRTTNPEHQGRPTPHDAHRYRIEDPHHRDRI